MIVDLNPSPETQRIQELNDAFRTSFIGGTVMLTAGIQALPEDTQNVTLKAVRSFNAFTPWSAARKTCER